MIKVGVVGGTGYTGVELLRLLLRHDQIELCVVTSRKEAGKLVSDCYPNLRGQLDLSFTEPSVASLSTCDVVFFATPNGTAMEFATELVDAGVRIIDLAADFRLKDADTWSQWYGLRHACPQLLEEAVYGLPEVNRSLIRDANIVANPGCYPTAVILGFLPLLQGNLIDYGSLIADAKSGVSGAGKSANPQYLLCEASENFSAYAIAGHRHAPEIEQTLQAVLGMPVGLTFVPHLTPMIRGIHATLYAHLQTSPTNLQQLYERRYIDEPFVDVLPPGSHPETRSVRGSNYCRIAVHNPHGDRVVVLSVIDNLVKGAAGQAVHNMNIMFGLSEVSGIDGVPFLP